MVRTKEGSQADTSAAHSAVALLLMLNKGAGTLLGRNKMISFTKESTHFYIISNVWIAASILADQQYDIIFAGAMGFIWFVYGLLISRRENRD
jgi:hypothetical protein